MDKQTRYIVSKRPAGQSVLFGIGYILFRTFPLVQDKAVLRVHFLPTEKRSFENWQFDMNDSEQYSRPEVAVFLPCHSLEDLSEWIENDDASAILNAWTVAWHPFVICVSDGLPGWASVDLPWTREGEIVGIVPEGLSERFTTGASPPFIAGQSFLHQDASESFLLELLEACCAEMTTDSPIGRQLETLSEWQVSFVEDFRSLGLTVLLFERLASRMRSDTNLDQTGFPEVVIEAAKAWRDDESALAQEKLTQAFQCLEAARDHFYPVECWCLDLVLFSESSVATLQSELQSPVPTTLLADTKTVSCFDKSLSDISELLQNRVADGSLSLLGSVSGNLSVALMSPEQLDREVAEGRAAWKKAAGVLPQIFGCHAGPRASIFLPVLQRLGYQGVLWSSFDGFPMPSAGAARFQWKNESKDQLDALEPKMLDARSSAAVLSLSSTLSDAMDHDHMVLIMFCHHAGTASPWFELLRRAASWTNVFGRFCTAETLLAETTDLSFPVSFEQDGFRVGLSPGTKVAGVADHDKFETSSMSQSDIISVESCQLVDNQGRYQNILQPYCSNEEVPQERGDIKSSESVTQRWGKDFLRKWLPKRQKAQDDLTLSSKQLVVRVHQQTGGIVSIRDQKDGRNRLSQQLALCWDEPGSHSSDFQYSEMVADRVDRCEDGIESHGTLIHDNGSVLARFSQKIHFILDGSAVSVSIVVEPSQELHSLVPSTSDALSRFFACRFAWNENDFCDLLRTVQTQCVETERQRIFSPWLLSIVRSGSALTRQDEKQQSLAASSGLQILTGCHPWHLRSSSHTLDTVLTTDCGTHAQTFQLALGIDLPHAVNSGFEWAATGSLQPPQMPLRLPPNVRLVSAATFSNDSVEEGLRLRLLESCGQECRMRLNFSRKVTHVCWNGEVHESQGTNEAGLVIDGNAIECLLHRYELVDLEIVFSENHHA